MDKGFIKLNRKSFAHKFWTKARVLSEFEAWVDLIQSARFDEAVKIEYIDGREIKYGRGQYPASIRFLSKKWSWGDQKVRSFLNELKRDGSIVTDSSQGMNIITLCKYEKYNSSYSEENTTNNTSDNTDISLILNELQQLKTQVLSQQITQSQHSGNTNNKKDKKEEEGYKEKNINVDLYVSRFNQIKGSKYKPNDKVLRQFNARIKEGYTVEQMIEALSMAMREKYHKETQFKYLTPEFFTRSDKIEMYSNSNQHSDSSLPQIGVGEYIENGKRYYGSQKYEVPMDMPPRPSERHYLNISLKQWNV